MHLAKKSLVLLAGLMMMATAAFATPVAEERVTGGTLDLVWAPGFGVSANMQALTLDPGHPAYDNPSGDHTVASAVNSAAPDSGGIILTATDPQGLSDYEWEAWIFTGDGDTRRGLVVRADPTDPNNSFASSYQFVIQPGLFQLNFRKLIVGAPTTLATWFSTVLPNGPLGPNEWHHMKVVANGSQFHCFLDGYELTQGTPIEDSDLPTGWVGVYNFRFDIGGIAFLTDDLRLSPLGATPARQQTWGQVKALYR
jgi:hypothetical protein